MTFFNKKEDGMNTKCTSWTNCTHDGSGDLGIKVGKIGGFIGCSKYPDCKYTISIGNFILAILSYFCINYFYNNDYYSFWIM